MYVLVLRTGGLQRDDWTEIVAVTRTGDWKDDWTEKCIYLSQGPVVCKEDWTENVCTCLKDRWTGKTTRLKMYLLILRTGGMERRLD
jgi:hypothetical protein